MATAIEQPGAALPARTVQLEGPASPNPGKCGGSRLSRRKRWLFRLVVLAGLYAALEVSSCLTLGLLDGKRFSFSRYRKERLALAAAGPQPDTPAPNGLLVVHPYLGVVLNPGWPGQLTGENPITPYGFCDTGTPIHHRAPDRVIIGIVGGSVASQFSAQGARALTRQLRSSPRFAGKKIELVNLAVRTFKQPQQIMALEYALALGGEFDILVNLDGFNEIAMYFPENASAGVAPLYPRVWHQVAAELPDPQLRRLLGECVYLERVRAGWARRFGSGPVGWCVTWNLAWRSYDRHLAAAEERARLRLHSYNPPAVPPHALGPTRRFATEADLFAELVAIWKRCSLQLARTCRGHGIEYYHFLQPNQYVAGSKVMSWYEINESIRQPSLVQQCVERGYPLLHSAGRELLREGVRFRDLTQVFETVSEPTYRDTCCHLNEHGNDLLAVEIGHALAQTPEPPR